MKKLLIAICLSLATVSQLAYAGHLNKDNSIKEEFHVTKADQKKAENIRRRTTLKDEEIYRLLNRGMSPTDIYYCYTIWAINARKIDEIADVYLDEDSLSLTLKDFEIEIEVFRKKFEELFPEELNEEVSRNVPWLRAPQ